MKSFKKRVGKLIQRRRRELGFASQQSLADAIGTDQPTVARWEAGHYFPNDEYIQKLQKVLKVDSDFFYGDEEESVPSDVLVNQISKLDRTLNDLGVFLHSLKPPDGDIDVLKARILQLEEQIKNYEAQGKFLVSPEDLDFLRRYVAANDLRRTVCRLILDCQSPWEMSQKLEAYLNELDADDRALQGRESNASQNKELSQKRAGKRRS